MTVENVAVEAANDTALPVAQADTTTQAAENTEQTEGENTEAEGEESLKQTSDDIEVEYEGQKFKVPPVIKDALLRQADYTRKTQELAELRKAADADREIFKGQTEAQKVHFKLATKLAGLDEQLDPYVKMTPQDWQQLRANNPDGYSDHWVNYDFLKNQRASVARDFSKAEEDRQGNAQRETAKRAETAYTEIARLVPEWTPNSEFERKIIGYGTGLGFKTDVLVQTILQEPKFAHHLKRLHDFDEAAKKAKTQQTFEQSQKAQPVTRVGGNGGSAARKTTDASGDTLSMAEWSKREDERVAAKRKAQGLR